MKKIFLNPDIYVRVMDLTSDSDLSDDQCCLYYINYEPRKKNLIICYSSLDGSTMVLSSHNCVKNSNTIF